MTKRSGYRQGGSSFAEEIRDAGYLTKPKPSGVAEILALGEQLKPGSSHNDYRARLALVRLDGKQVPLLVLCNERFLGNVTPGQTYKMELQSCTPGQGIGVLTLPVIARAGQAILKDRDDVSGMQVRTPSFKLLKPPQLL